MSKIYIDGTKDDSPIDTIGWINQDQDYGYIENCREWLDIVDGDNELRMFKKDIPKLEAALAKARELGWFE